MVVPAQCLEIEQFLLNPAELTMLNILLALLFACLLAIGILFQQFIRFGLPVHGNLRLLFGNIVLCTFVTIFSFFLMKIRYKYLLLTYTHPCQLLTPFWMVALGNGPITYVYNFAHPALHFCVMLERLRATFQAQKYEQEGLRWGICMVLAIWLIAFAYSAFAITACYLETGGGQVQGIQQLTSRPSAQLAVYIMVLNLLFVLLTSFGDWRITAWNRRIHVSDKYDGFVGYSLSRNYQVQENVIAMRLILPLDVCNALLYSLYAAAIIALRANFSTGSLSMHDFHLGLEIANALNFTCTFLTMIVYILFVRFVSRSKRKANTATIAMNDHTKIYFKQLEAQWN